MAETRPALASATPPAGKTPESIGSALMRPDIVQRIASVVPKHLTPERMLRVASQAVGKTKNLDKVPFVQLVGGIMMLSSLGLEPNTILGHAYLIPFGKRVQDETGRWVDGFELQVIIGYRGYVELMRRSGVMISIHADVAYKGDFFDFEYGSNQHLKHIPKGDVGATPLFAYAHAKLKDGEAFEVLPYARVLAIRNSSQAYQQALRMKNDAANETDAKKKKWKEDNYLGSPWVKHEHEMAAKTMVRRLAKMMPLSIELQNSLELDAAQDQGKPIDYAAMVDLGAGASLEFGADDEAHTTIEHQSGDQAGTVERGNREQQEGEKVQAEPKKEPAKTTPKKDPAPAAKVEPAKVEPKKAEPEKPKASDAPTPAFV